LLRLCAAAADAVAPFALFSRSENAGDAETARLDALPLLRDALSCACHPVPVSGSSASGVARCAWPADPETANAAATLRLRALEAFVFAPAFLFDSASPRRKLDDETLGDKSSRMSVFDAAVGACAALPTADLPNADLPDHERTYVSSSPDLFLRRALNSADAPLGPWHGEESDAASGSLRRFEGANDAPPFSPWRLSCRPTVSSDAFSFREEDTVGFAAGLGATLRFARARALARVAAESPSRAPAVLAATAAEAAAAANGDDASGSVFFAAAPAAGNQNDLLSPKPFSSADDLVSGGAVTTSRPASPLGSPAKRANGRHRRAASGGGGSGGLFALPGSMGGSNKAEEKRKLDAATRAERAASSLTSACVASLAVAEAMAVSFERKRSLHARRRNGDADDKALLTDVAKRKEDVFRNLRLLTASSLAEVASAVSGSRFAGAAHWRAAAELEAAAAAIRDDAAAAADALRARAAELANTPVTRGGSSSGGSSDASTKLIQKHRAAACVMCAASFRRAGVLAMAAATRPLASALAVAAAELDGTPFFSEASHLWAAHALSVVAAHAGPAFEKRAPATLELAFALLNSTEANDVVDGDVRRDSVQTETEETRGKENGVLDSVNASRAASSLRAACGRLVNAAVAAVGPELDAVSPAATNFFAFASALMDAVSDGGEGGATGAGAYAAFARSDKKGEETESSTARSAFRLSFRLTDAGDAACRHEAATYVQQLALFAPRVATPARLVPRLRASLASGRPALRRAAAQTLKHLCERDAGAVARAAAADGGGLEGDLLRFVDQRGDGDPVAATHAKRALRLLTRNASVRVSPASAMKTLAAVALWTPGGGARADDAGFQSEEGENPENRSVVSGSRHDGFRASGAPKLATRVLAAALIAEAPTAAAASASGGGDFAYDVTSEESSICAPISVADARAAVDCAYRLATAPATALRPAGLRALRATLASLRGREDPDAPVSSNGKSSLFAAQFQAQTLSALRAAREPDASPRCFAEGAHLAATAAACGLDAGDPRAARLIRAFVREPLEAWLDEEEATTTSCDSSSDEQTLETVSSPLTRRGLLASCAEGIVVRLRVAALVSSARLYLLDETTAESDETSPISQKKPTDAPRLSLATRWAAAAADFANALVHGADESDSRGSLSEERNANANANANAKKSSGALEREALRRRFRFPSCPRRSATRAPSPMIWRTPGDPAWTPRRKRYSPRTEPLRRVQRMKRCFITRGVISRSSPPRWQKRSSSVRYGSS
jgi:hypothetical protein